MQIFVENRLSGQCIPLDVETSDSIRNVKAKISRSWEGTMPLEKQELWCKNQQLLDDHHVSDYAVKEGSSIRLLKRWQIRHTIQIFVNTLSDTITLNDVGRSDNIHDVKEKIEKTVGTPIEQQHLSFNGTKLDDHRYLWEFNITQGSRLDLVKVWCEPREESEHEAETDGAESDESEAPTVQGFDPLNYG